MDALTSIFNSFLELRYEKARCQKSGENDARANVMEYELMN
jgi:hypothetical protein